MIEFSKKFGEYKNLRIEYKTRNDQEQLNSLLNEIIDFFKDSIFDITTEEFLHNTKFHYNKINDFYNSYFKKIDYYSTNLLQIRAYNECQQLLANIFLVSAALEALINIEVMKQLPSEFVQSNLDILLESLEDRHTSLLVDVRVIIPEIATLLENLNSLTKLENFIEHMSMECTKDLVFIGDLSSVN
jgi:hypothetical protein